MKILYKLSKSVVPCILLTLCIGFCYAFSLFTPHIAEILNCSVKAVQFTFCLNIFFLGMGAALFGPLVEKKIRIATTVSAALLTLGLLLGGFACSTGNILLMYLGCGVMCGLAEGCGYVAPNKNMLLWFPSAKNKGILAAISIFTFGLGSALCSWLFGCLFPHLGIAKTFYYLALIYAIPSFAAAMLINKPKYALIKLQKQKKTLFSYVEKLKDPFFRKVWLFMFLNISMGLILIGSCASILKDVNLSNQMVIITMMLCGIFNGVGRIAFPAISDFLKNRVNITMIIVLIEIILMALSLSWLSAIPFCVVICHACYGAAFAVLPSILASYYGKDTLSQTHGFCLTSWGMASLMAYLCMTFVMKFFTGLYPVIAAVLVGYCINAFVVRRILNEVNGK